MSVSNKKSIDMTSGALWNKILLFALPLAASSILQQLFNSVDTAGICKQSGTGGCWKQQFFNITYD